MRKIAVNSLDNVEYFDYVIYLVINFLVDFKTLSFDPLLLISYGKKCKGSLSW